MTNETDFLKLYQNSSIFVLDERFSEPIWDYYYNLRSLSKYWFLTKNLIAESIFNNSIFKNASFESSELISQEIEFEDVDFENAVGVDGHEIETDLSNIPHIQRNLILSNVFTMIEKLLKDVCTEIDTNYTLNGKGSYIQQYYHFIKNNSSIEVPKKYLRAFEAFGHLRNSYLHQFDLDSVPIISKNYIDELCGPFVQKVEGVSNIHVEVLIKIASEFGEQFQTEYWRDYENSKKS